MERKEKFPQKGRGRAKANVPSGAENTILTSNVNEFYRELKQSARERERERKRASEGVSTEASLLQGKAMFNCLIMVINAPTGKDTDRSCWIQGSRLRSMIASFDHVCVQRFTIEGL